MRRSRGRGGEVVGLAREAHVAPEWITCLNRLSDLLFTLARYVNHRAAVADVPWVPNPR